jgi:hypothetical protein
VFQRCLVRNFSTTSSVSALPREEFLYDFKRRLRAAASRPSSPPSTGAHGSPAFPRPPQHGPAVPTTRLPSSSMVGRRRVGSGGSTSRVRAPRPGTLHPDADRPILRRLVGMHTARPLSRAGKRVRPANGHTSPTSMNFFSSSTPDSGHSVCAVATCRPRQGGAPSGLPTSQRRPASVPLIIHNHLVRWSNTPNTLLAIIMFLDSRRSTLVSCSGYLDRCV